MQRIFKGLVWTIGAALIVYAAMVVWGHWRGPDAAQAKALALMQQDLRPAKGHNAFPALWLAEYDVPPDQMDAVYAQDRQRMSAWLAALPHDGSSPGDFVNVATAQYNKLPPLTAADRALSCNQQGVDCLARVREHRDALRALLSQQQIRLNRDKAIVNDDYEWNDLPPNDYAIPRYGGTQSLWPSAAVLDFVDGRQTEALNQICLNAQAMRRMHAHNNTMLSTMIAGAHLKRAAYLFTRMLSELPAATVLPDTCVAAFAPVTADDLDMCASMQWEFHFVEASSLMTEAIQTHWWDVLLFSREGTRRLVASRFAWVCSDAVRAQLLEDRPFILQATPEQADLFDWASNSTGSSLVQIAWPTYVSYLNGQQDTAAVLRLVATIVWLRQTHGDGRTLADRLQQRPAWMHLAADRKLRVSADGRSLQMGYRVAASNGPAEWPLAGP